MAGCWNPSFYEMIIPNMIRRYPMDAKKTGAITVAVVLLVMACSYLEYGQERPYDDVVNELATKLHTVDESLDEILSVYEADSITITASDPQPDIPSVILPSKLDLRDYKGRNIVSPIKDQGNLGTCWAFSALKAAEISYVGAMGYDYNEGNVVDFSEKHLAWFTYEPIREGSQAGEGFWPSDDSWDTSDITVKVIRNGGYKLSVIALLSGGMGPIDESLVPYKPIEGTDVGYRALVFTVCLDEEGLADRSTQEMIRDWDHVSVDEYNGLLDELSDQGIHLLTDEELSIAENDGLLDHAGEKVGYASYYPDPGDYSVEESLRYNDDRLLINYNAIPNVALADEDNRYLYNAVATEAIKIELNLGRGVSVAYLADVSMPGEQNISFLNFLDADGKPATDKNAAIWAHYTYDVDYEPYNPASVNEVVTANHEVCIIGYDDDFPKEYFKDPNGTIGGNGAWLVANSWGTGWGNGGDGTFWLSYYDQSLVDPASLIITDDSGLHTEKYDYMPDFLSYSYHSQSKIQMANVFQSESSETLISIGVETVHPDTTIIYTVYKLNDDYTSPIEGKLVAKGSASIKYAGYHSINLDSKLELNTGDAYSIIIEQIDCDGYVLYTSAYKNESGTEYYDRIYQSNNPWINDSWFYSKGVVNPGESYVMYDDRWLDWFDVTAVLHLLNIEMNNDGLDYDNFPIVAYLNEESLSFYA